MRNVYRDILGFLVGFLIGHFIVILFINTSDEKPISYPEEIQIAKAGDTLIVSSVSDSIYIGFKHSNNNDK